MFLFQTFSFLSHVEHTVSRRPGVTSARSHTTVAIKAHFLSLIRLHRDKATWNSFWGISLFQLCSWSLISGSKQSTHTHKVCWFSVPTVHRIATTHHSTYRTQYNNNVWTSHSTTRHLSVFESNNDEPVQEIDFVYFQSLPDYRGNFLRAVWRAAYCTQRCEWILMLRSVFEFNNSTFTSPTFLCSRH